MSGKELVATTVSSREVGIKRREEGKHKGQRDETRTGNGGGRQQLKHVDGDFPWCMRRKSEDNEAKTRENENSRGKGGGRHKLRHVDGDVPLSTRSKGEEDKDSSSKKEIEVGSSKKDRRMKATWRSNDLCGRKVKNNKESAKTEEEDITFIVLQKIRDQ